MRRAQLLAVRRRPTIISTCSSSLRISQVRHERSFFGLGEVVGVLANPGETVRQLKEAKELLIKSREEAALRKEKERIPKKHTFSQLPGFHGRKAEQGMSLYEWIHAA
jgi:hypothetical protein